MSFSAKLFSYSLQFLLMFAGLLLLGLQARNIVRLVGAVHLENGGLKNVYYFTAHSVTQEAVFLQLYNMRRHPSKLRTPLAPGLRVLLRCLLLQQPYDVSTLTRQN
jgi:hypothetical protein